MTDKNRPNKLVLFSVAMASCFYSLLCGAQPSEMPETEPRVILVAHSQGAGANAIDMNADDPEGLVNVDYYHYFFATGSGQRQFGTNLDVTQQNVSTPLGLGSPLQLSAEASQPGGAAKAATSLVVSSSDNGFTAIGTVLANSDSSSATAFSKLMLGVVITGRSTVRVENCALFEPIGLPVITSFFEPEGTCRFKASGDPASGMDPQGLPLPASATDGQFIMFEIDIEKGGYSQPPGSVQGGFAIEILPGAGECIIVTEGAGTSMLEDWAMTDIFNSLPDATWYTRTDSDVALIQDEIDISSSDFANEEAHELAAAAAANLVRPVDADIRFEFTGVGAPEGTHTVLITPRGQEPRMFEFEFQEGWNFADIEAFVEILVSAVGEFAQDC